MGKKIWIIGIIVFVIFTIGGIWIYNNAQRLNQSGNVKYEYSEITYDDCIKQDNAPSECEKYIFTRNAKAEQKFSEILNQVIQEQSQRGVTISVKEIQVLNLAGKMQGLITLSCEKISYEKDKNIAENIANKLFLEYPNDFSEESERDSWVDLRGCSESGGSSDGINSYSHTTAWRISDGNFDALI